MTKGCEPIRIPFLLEINASEKKGCSYRSCVSSLQHDFDRHAPRRRHGVATPQRQ